MGFDDPYKSVILNRLVTKYLFLHNMATNGSSRSCVKINGRPRPVMTYERRQQCRLWRKEAMLKERELELKRKEKEVEKLRVSYESSLLSLSRPSSSVDSGASCMLVIEQLREVVYNDDMPVKKFHQAVREIVKELKKIGNDPVIDPSDKEELYFLLNELCKKLTKRNSPYIPEPGSTVKHCDSTLNDVAHITLNQNSDPPSSCDTIREVSYFSLDKKSVINSSKIHHDVSLHSESTFKSIEECTPDDDSCLFINSLPTDGNQSIFCDVNVFTSSPRCSAEISEASPANFDVDYNKTISCDNSNLNTPTKLVRRNSYTLESPSPSVLAYIRNLRLETSSVQSTSISHDEKYEQVYSGKSAVRNLNDVWNKVKEEGSEKCLKGTSPGFRDSLEDVDDERSVENDENRNFKSTEYGTNFKDLHTSYHEHKLALSVQEKEKLLKQTKAAITIQSYIRGYFVRRLMRTQKVEQIKNTIKDAIVCAWGLYKEQAVTTSDIHLHERITQQVNAACNELHCIFFMKSTSDKMALIRADRERLKAPKPRIPRAPRERKSESQSGDSSRSTSLTRSHSSLKTHKRTKSNEGEFKRPSTLPLTPRSISLHYQPWR